MSRARLHRPDPSDLDQHGSRVIEVDRDRPVFRDLESADREQIVRLPEDLVVRMDLLDERSRGEVVVAGPDERDQGKFEGGHGPDVHRHPSALRDASRDAQPRVERTVRIDLDDHLETGLNHFRRDFGVRGKVEFSLPHLGRDCRRTGGHIHHMHLHALHEECGPHRRDFGGGLLFGRDECAEERTLPGHEGNRVATRLDGLRQISLCRASRPASLDTSFQDGLEPGPKGRFIRRAQSGAARDEFVEIERSQRLGDGARKFSVVLDVQFREPPQATDLRRQGARKHVVRQGEAFEVPQLAQLRRESPGEPIPIQIEVTQPREGSEFDRDRAFEPVVSDPEEA